VVVCNAIAAAIVLLSASAAGGPSLGHQVTWINLAVLATLLAVVANGCLFLVARRAIGRRRLALVPDVEAHDRAVRSEATGAWYRVSGTTRAHRPGCPMVEGKRTEQVSVAVIRAERLSRCEMCG
jgi:hypothetical protein